MNKLKILFISLLLVSLSIKADDINDVVTFAQVDPFMKVFPESSFFNEFNDTVEVAAGEHATFQFVVRSGKTLKNLCINVSDFKNLSGVSLSDIRTGFVDYVQSSRKVPERANDALTPLSDYYPDPIIEKNNWQTQRDMAQPMWVTLSVPKTAHAGVYKAKFELKGLVSDKSFTLSKDICVKVYPVVMENPSLHVTNWFHTDKTKLKVYSPDKNIEQYSAGYWRMVNQIARWQKECYSNVIILSPLDHVEFSMNKDSVYAFDFTHFDQMIDAFNKSGMLKMIEGGHIGGRMGDWDSQFGVSVPIIKGKEKTLVKMDIESQQARNFYQQFMPALYNHMKKRYPDLEYSQHIADEPISSNINSYVKIAKFVKKLCPGIKLIEACHTHDLDNVIDIWVPQLNFYREGYDFYCKRQQAGDKVWFYTCLSPQGNYANRFIELPLIKTRLVHWLNFKYGATGYLHWGFNAWFNQNTYQTSGIIEESGNIMPGGDGWIVYPKDGKLYGSIRLEAMRDGIADYTLLSMLKKKNPALANELCRLVVYGWDKYDTDSSHFRSIRHKILEALSK